MLSLSSHAIEFHSCKDDKGLTHYTNLPVSSVGQNCSPKDRYTVMLNQDYVNLAKEYAKYQQNNQSVNSNNDAETDSKPFELSKSELSPDAIKNKVKDIFDPDKALEELMDATEDRDDVFTRAMRGRSERIESIVNQGKLSSP
jgi:3-methyladenine DNA glycosylase/8-oxoguanine DNA glycosylase